VETSDKVRVGFDTITVALTSNSVHVSKGKRFDGIERMIEKNVLKSINKNKDAIEFSAN
jgi:hypothetical protein